jgi:hypothetical protein
MRRSDGVVAAMIWDAIPEPWCWEVRLEGRKEKKSKRWKEGEEK